MLDDEGVMSDFDSGISDDDDNELQVEYRTKNENYLEETIPQYTEKVFFEHFRVSREVVNSISEKYENSQYFHNHSGQFGMIPATDQLLIYLWYMGHQTASFRDVADRFNITISSVNRVIQRLTYFLSNLSPEIIKWPNDVEKRTIEEHFRENGFPNIIGAIDGCHFKIDKAENDPESYINRKGYYSIQMQAVCDHQRKILDVFIGYPGSVHDSRVFRISPLGNNLEEKCNRYFILGDSGYPLQNHLLVPFKDRGNLTRRQQNYNNKLRKNRYVIEHCFSILKQKFRQMYHIKLRSIRFIVHFIRAACVLHNIALNDNFDVGEVHVVNIPEANYDDNEDDEVEDNMEAREVRERVVNVLQI